jgi:dihydroxyacetone kinase DhaKLM complex PTS-EIIA-like component DhaM
VLSADLALELLDESTRSRVTLSAGPLVEGLVVAAVTASTGAGRDAVARAADDALHPKRVQLGR